MPARSISALRRATSASMRSRSGSSHGPWEARIERERVVAVGHAGSQGLDLLLVGPAQHPARAVVQAVAVVLLVLAFAAAHQAVAGEGVGSGGNLVEGLAAQVVEFAGQVGRKPGAMGRARLDLDLARDRGRIAAPRFGAGFFGAVEDQAGSQVGGVDMVAHFPVKARRHQKAQREAVQFSRERQVVVFAAHRLGEIPAQADLPLRDLGLAQTQRIEFPAQGFQFALGLALFQHQAVPFGGGLHPPTVQFHSRLGRGGQQVESLRIGLGQRQPEIDQDLG
jgi:hypothetical protein